MSDIILADGAVQLAVRQLMASNRGTSKTLNDSLLRAARIITGLPETEPTTVPWDRLTGGSLRLIISKMREGGYAAATINHTLAAVKKVANQLWLNDILRVDEYQKILAVKGLKADRRKVGRSIPDDEQARMLDACRDDRERALILLLLWGLRRVEVIRLNRTHITRTDGGIEVEIKGKGGKWRTIPIVGKAADIIWRYRNSHQGTPLFVGKRGEQDAGRITPAGISWLYKEICLRAGITDTGTHNGRRTAATQMYEANVPVADIAAFLGHSSIDTTQRYIREVEEGARNRNAAAALSKLRAAK